MNSTVKVPFLFVNPKAYIYGGESLALALAADRISEQTGVQIFYTCQFTDLHNIKRHTKNIIVTAENMDALQPGRGMGAILPESLIEAGAGAVVLNHAEKQKTLAELYACIVRARELDLTSIVCADSIPESRAVAELGGDIVLAEPTNLIGTGITADSCYISDAVAQVKKINPDIKVMVASGITTAEDCYRTILLGADGTGATSGIIKAPVPVERVGEMAKAIVRAMADRQNKLS